MTDIKHSPLPWMIYGTTQIVPETAKSNPFTQIADTSHGMSQAQNKANARFIELAVNSHYELLEALKALNDDPGSTVARTQARVAISKATPSPKGVD